MIMLMHYYGAQILKILKSPKVEEGLASYAGQH